MWLGRGKIEESVREVDGLVLVNIKIERKDRQTRIVSIRIKARPEGNKVFDAEYETSQSEVYAYYGAKEHVNKFLQDNDYVIDVETTNATLPTVRTTNKRSR
ncbi:hypothetical protein [Halobacillus campisalis]|uniref:Uncharacterized protein n=1 Tax=Halobacillus campisalis TaxID=435909 RepID=A0ABW2K6L4_9BACI|nr:hypothetical protein [Halobacillus campisalis]